MRKYPLSKDPAMQTINALVDLLLGFVPMLGIAAVLLTAFWIATKLIPGLGEWMSDTRDMEAAQEYVRPNRVENAPHSHRWN
jgi:hypothetical protein